MPTTPQPSADPWMVTPQDTADANQLTMPNLFAPGQPFGDGQALGHDGGVDSDDLDGNHPGNVLRDVGRNLGMISARFFVSLAGFIVCLTAFTVGASTFWLVFGLFVLVGCLYAAGGFSAAYRELFRSVGVKLPLPAYPVEGPGFWGQLNWLRSGQAWRDLLHVMVAFVIDAAAFPLAITWVLGGPGGLLYGFWSKYLPDDDKGLAWLLGFPGHLGEVAINTTLGAVVLFTTPAVLRWIVAVQTRVAQMILVDEKDALRQQVTSLTTSREAAGDAEVTTLRRLERDLHDGPQQRLVRLGMDITAAQRRLDSDPEQARQLLDEALTQSQDALAEIRTLSRGIAPPILAELGLRAAITALASQNPIPVSVDVADVELSDTVRNAAYFMIAESLANVAKHSRATESAVEVRKVGRHAMVTISDDGVGGASVAKGHGLAGLQDRLAGVDGRLSVHSPDGGPTLITGVLPLEQQHS